MLFVGSALMLLSVLLSWTCLLASWTGSCDLLMGCCPGRLCVRVQGVETLDDAVAAMSRILSNPQQVLSKKR